MRFLDTNVLLRYFTRDDQKKAAAALHLLERVEAGEEKIFTSPLVVFETIFTLQRFYKVSREQIREILEPILSLPGLRLENKGEFLEAFKLYVESSISYADAYSVAYMRYRGIAEVYSWDTDFDLFKDIHRVEPGRV